MKLPEQFEDNWGLVAVLIVVGFLAVLMLSMIVAVFTSGGIRFAACGFVGLMILVLFVAIPITAIVFFVRKLRNTAETNDQTTYSEFAKAVDGRVIRRRQPWRGKPRTVEFSYRGFPCVIDSIAKRVAEGHAHFMRYIVELPYPPEFQCQVGPDFILDLGRFFRPQDVKLGWRDFDDAFRIEADDPALARKMLNRVVQQILLDLREFSGEIRLATFDQGYVRLKIDDDQLLVQVLGGITKPEEMFRFHKLCTELLDQLLPQLAPS